MSKIIRCFLNTNMACQHRGLSKLMREHKIEPEALPTGSHVIFINGKKNKLKMWTAGGVLSYVALKRSRKIDLKTIQFIPESFNGKELDYDRAVRKMLKEELI